MQKEFINIASHEMKIPTQAILRMSGLLQYYPQRRDELIGIIQRNAKRLQALTSEYWMLQELKVRHLNLRRSDLTSLV